MLDRTYETHDNGGRPFTIAINDDIATITHIESNTVYVQRFIQCFVGEADNHSEAGNSILLLVNANKYVYIGHKMFTFTSIALIITYRSPIGNSDVPYPYAIDEDGNVYLLIEDAVIRNFIQRAGETCVPRTPSFQFILPNPYEFYYQATLLMKLQHQTPMFDVSLGFDEWYVDGESYALRLTLKPEKYRQTHMHIRRKGCDLEPYPYEDFERLMRRVAEQLGVEPLNII